MTTCHEPLTIDHVLADFASETPDQTEARTLAEWDGAAGTDRQIVVFGCGYLGRFVLPGLRAAGLEAVAYCDNNQRIWGSDISGIPVLSPEEAIRRFPGLPFLVAVYNASPVRRQLRKAGCRVVSYPAFYWRYPEAMRAEERLGTPADIARSAEAIAAAYKVLADEKSRVEFTAQIRWRSRLDYDCLPPHDPPAEMYYPSELFRLSKEEVLVDCGAFDGDSVRSFLEKAGFDFKKIYALEPDRANLASLRDSVSGLPREVGSRIETCPYAVGDRNGVVYFHAEASAGSKIAAGGSIETECRTLDGLPGEPAPTLIKMDIEGAEAAAIRGASRTIEKHRPILAVCAYHHYYDLWTLPKLLLESNPDYKIFLRRYAEECWETVYYAIPRERLTAKVEEHE